MVRAVLRFSLTPSIVAVLIVGQLFLSVPLAARSAPELSTPPPAEPQAALPAPAVRVNRTVPVVAPPPLEPQFSAQPTVQEIFRARVFAEPLVPVGGEPSPEDNRLLADALLAFHRGGGLEWRSAFGTFLLTRQASPWRASLLANIAVLEARRHGYSRALSLWEDAWVLAKDATDPRGRAVADFALSESLLLSANFGQVDAVHERLASIADRPIAGTAGVNVARAREIAALIGRERHNMVPCAAEALLAYVAATRGSDAAAEAALRAYRAPAEGTSLVQLRDLAAQVGSALRMVARTIASDVPVPSIVHLKIGHYSTVVERDGDRYRIADGAQGASYWMTRDTLLEETSGYFLIPDPAQPDGWRAVDETEGDRVRGFTGECPPGAPPVGSPCVPPKCCPTGGAGGGGGGGGGGPCGNGGSCGMVTYSFEDVTASLLLFDTPVGYTPPRGPAVPLALSYHQRHALQPQVFSMSNVGPKWTFGWMRFVQEVPGDALGGTVAHVWVYEPPGGREVYSNPDPNGVYPSHWASRAALVKVSATPIRYERRRPDGTIEVYALSDGAPAGQRRVLLTELIDPLGHQLTFTWDAQLRLVAIVDAIGQVTTLSYEASDPLKLTRITDPFGRAATLTYNAAGQLASITDVLGLMSSFAYGPNDFVNALRTPYGITSFRHEPNALNDLNFRFIEATDPLGGTEHLEFQWQTPSLSATVPAGEVPTGFAAWNTNLDHYNTFYWDKRAWMLGKGDLSKATVTHWMTYTEWPSGQLWSAPIPHSVKKPLEARVWYAYPGQTTGSEGIAGWWREASRVGRVLDDGTSQVSEKTFNTFGLPLIVTDPLGRQSSYGYGINGVDLIEVRQTTGGMNEVLATYTNFNTLHQPQSMTDAAGQTTTMTYNPAGQVLTVTNAKNETTTYVYDAYGRLSSVTGPVAGATTTYTYDGYARMRTVTDSDNYTVTLDYDVFDRPIRTTYPDGTYEETAYDRLDISTRRDRAGRFTRYYYDAMRRLVATRDPAGRVVVQEWCACGGLDGIVDGKSNRTRWERDLQGRVTREVRADGTTATVYTYQPLSGRLSTVTDPKNQVTTYGYHRDDAVASTTYTNAVIATPGVSYTYDAQYGRVATMTDGIGVTTYSYHPVSQLGAGQVAGVDGPLTNDLITYAYDQLGRVTTRTINGAANSVTWAFDALGRVTSETNVLGTFIYTYEGVTGRVATVTYPNAQTSTYTYFGNANDHRLQTIHHKYPNGSTLSKFDYTYDAVGSILTWRQQADTTAVLWEFGYDLADQLVAAVKKSTDPTPVVLKRYSYGYDPAGNRTVEQIDDQVTGATYDNLNRLVSQQPSGAMVFTGTVNEPAAVTVQGIPAVVTSANEFRTSVPVGSGTNTVTVTAKDPSGNLTTRQYEVDNFASGRTFTYDANGNLTADGTRTFEWDARNQLVAVTVGTHRSEFTYDGLRHRVRMIEREQGVVQTDRRLIWCEDEVCEERDPGGTTVLRRRFEFGEQAATVPQFFSMDHLGSVRDVADGNTVKLGHYALDPWGRRTLEAGVDATDIAYTGHQWHRANLLLTANRSYDPELGRWLSPDPMGLIDGPNLYAYVSNKVTRLFDPLGLQSCCDELTKRRQRLHDILDTIEQGKIPSGGLAGSTSCAGNSYSMDMDWINQFTNPCWRDCVVAHENVHARQCRRIGSDGIAKLSYKSAERPAFLTELGCVIKKMRDQCCE